MAKGSSRITGWLNTALGSAKPSAPIPPQAKNIGQGAASFYNTTDFVPPNLPAPNSEPASQAESTLKASLQNVAEATFGHRGPPHPEDK